MMDGSALDLATNIGMMNAAKSGNGGIFGGDGGGIWILIILFFIIGFGGGGFGFGNTGAAQTITNEFLYTNLNNTLDRGFNQVSNQNFQMSKELCSGFNGIQQELMNNRFASQQCCCETNRNIDAVRYENAKNTCDIITAGHADTQRILDQMNSEKIEALRSELQSAQLALANTVQTRNIVSELRPVPVPAYLTCSPYTAYNGYNTPCGYAA